MAVDPGQVTGVAVVTVPGFRQTLRETLSQMEELHSWEVRGSIVEQSNQLTDSWQDFFALSNIKGFAWSEIHLVVENFILRTKHADITPAWVLGGLEVGLAHRCPGIPGIVGWQEPSDAKNLMTNERLRSLGLWQVGSAHTRDAVRHAVLRLNRLLGT
jgi:hypothetical protein